MTRQVLIHSPAVNRRPSFFSGKHTVAAPAATGAHGRGPKSRASEVAGRTAADCTALCCCCPCTVMNILVLAVYKVPAGLCRKASMRKQKRSVAKKRAGAVSARQAGGGAAGAKNADESDGDNAAEDSVADLLNKGDVEGDDDAAAVDDLEKEMWDRFHNTGFWRSPSMRDT
ncbi:uncharacterized protein LOC116212303 [Punica granatum]|nr:uncharacterized protein LOC116212303 [Punica granatum]